MPKQNRPLVRDGRLQAAKKKRTDRSYLGGAGTPTDAPAAPAEEPVVEAAGAPEEVGVSIDEVMPAGGPAPAAAQPAAAPAAAPTAAAPTAARPAGRLPTSVRALQQQGIRRRRELDVDALAERDTRYAIHELRRILILATMVIVTLIVLGVVLR